MPKMDTVSLYQQLPNNTHYVVSTKIKRGDEIALRVLIHKFLPKTNNKKKIFTIISLNNIHKYNLLLLYNAQHRIKARFT